MLRTKFHGNRLTDSVQKKKIFKGILIIYGHGGHIGHDPNHLKKTISLFPLAFIFNLWFQDFQYQDIHEEITLTTILYHSDQFHPSRKHLQRIVKADTIKSIMVMLILW